MGKLLVVIAIAGLVCFGWLVCKSETKWHRFVVAHDCKVFAQKEDQYVPMVTSGPNGSVSITTMYIPGERGWRCNNGKEYWR